MNTVQSSEFISTTDFLWKPTESEQDSLWGQSQIFQTVSGQWRAYLNQLSVQAFILWAEDRPIKLCPDFADQHHAAWLTGAPVIMGDKRLVILPSDTFDADELRVPQEWIDIPRWVADYYIAAQVNSEEGYVRLWGYTTHRELKETGKYCERDRTYTLSSDALACDLSSLFIALESLSESQTQVPVVDLPTLAMNQAETILEQCGNPDELCTRLIVPFEMWGALLSHQRLRRMLAQRYLLRSASSSSPIVHLQQWLNQLFPEDWRSLREVMEPVRSRHPMEVSTHSLSRAKIIDLGLLLEGQSLVLILWIQPTNEQQYQIKVEVRPGGTRLTLPPQLKMTILDEGQTSLAELLARNQDSWIELSFTVDPGTAFKVQLSLADAAWTESFII